MTGPVIHPEILTARQQTLLARLGPLATSWGYVLAGGTAVALRLGHRRSDDFDWFARAPRLTGTDIVTSLAAEGLSIIVQQAEPGTVLGTIESVKVSFFGYPYDALDPTETLAGFGCELASMRDLSAMKLLAVAQRSERKDFIDIHELLATGGSLANMLDAFKLKFPRAEPLVALRGLTYFDEVESQPMPDMLTSREWAAVKDALRRAVREVMT